MHDMHAFAQLRRELIEMTGPLHARHVLTRYGSFWGRADASAMERAFGFGPHDMGEWLRAGARLHSLQGVAKTEIRSLDFDLASGRFRAEYVWRHPCEAASHLAELGHSEHPVCWILAGYASGYCSRCMGRDIYFIERQCEAMGDLACIAEGRDASAWQGEHSKALAFFEKSEDIASKIDRLSAELSKRSKELESHKRRVLQLEAAAGRPADGFAEIRSPSFLKLVESAQRVARFDSSILVSGESGTGKEVVAKFIHSSSTRNAMPFVAVNCGALPESLLEAELFGHKAGSFTGATRDRAGLFEEADKGTLFLDEIGEISLPMQVKLLRALQEREIMRVGESKPRKIDVRVIAATNRNLEQAVSEGRFREDLYYRLAVVRLEMPPLRTRPEDIIPLARTFVSRFAKKLKLPNLRLDPAAANALQNYSWPGNVRELENAIERGAIFSSDGLITVESLPAAVCSKAPGFGPGRPASDKLEDIEMEHILRILKDCGGNRARAGKRLGISQATLWRKLKEDPEQDQ
jgi:transcriptional regulator with PAS, ATPase and Fis domain/predicted hydrocarbon binding protein